MNKSTYITLAIHTYDRAIILKQILESNGIDVKLQNVNLTEPTISSGVRVRISEKDLPLALKITESSSSISPALFEMRIAGMSGNILIPIDLSDYSMIACKVGFQFAKSLSLHPVLLHTFVTPYLDGVLPLSDARSADLHDMALRDRLEDKAKRQMKEFCKLLKQNITEGILPNVGFTTIVREGVPEEVIQDYAKNSPPSIIVMATRGKDKKEKEVIGSVTAEVFDSCRVPVFSVPEGFESTDFSNIKKVIFFCNVNQQDILSMDTFVRLFNNQPMEIFVVPVNDRAGINLNVGIDKLVTYFKTHYPEFKFSSKIILSKTFRAEIEQMISDCQVELLVVPNKKKSIFSRLFNPSIAHKIIFEKDIPMLVLPV